MYDTINSRYTYKNSNVIKNKLNITDEKLLVDKERKLVKEKIKNMDKSFAFFEYNEDEFKGLHKYLFGDIYDFAGEYRLENITKENFKFSLYEYIDENIKKIFSRINLKEYSKLSYEELLKEMSHLLTELNVLHPFREGNGRTIRVFISKLLEELGYKINFSNIDYDEIVRVSKLAVIDETEQIELLRKNIINKSFIYDEKILEKGLPKYLENDIAALKEGLKNNVKYLDCLVNEVQGSVNSAWVDGDISEEQCDYLYKKYIRIKID